jgi:hypothetical protein
VWNKSEARGTATVWLSGCPPRCAGQISFRAYRGTVLASHVDIGGPSCWTTTGECFTRLKISYSYRGHRLETLLGLGFHGHLFSPGVYYWNAIF